MIYHCCETQRLEVVRRADAANGIAFIEVRDHLEPDPLLRQRTLFVRLLQPGFSLGTDQLRIDGGQRIPVVGVEWAAAADNLPAGVDPALVDGLDDLPRTLVIRTTTAGDFSRYTLRLLASGGSSLPPAGFDALLSSIVFSFKVECPSPFDCGDAPACPAPQPLAPDIDYLAKDYPGFRRLMLDRLNLLVPGWRERSAADLGMTLVELLAYAADQLSYRQDAIANEAYLGTARRRVSVRRHARLVDYRLHDGCNARVWVHLPVAGADIPLPQGSQLLTRVPGAPALLAPGSRALDEALASGARVFETTAEARLHADLNTLNFYTWGERGCCLPRGATSATLRGAHPALQAGAVLVLQEVVSPTTDRPEDADRAHRWAVRLTRAEVGSDPLGGLFDEPPANTPVDVTHIAWDALDALPFPLCLSVAERPGRVISLALGNIVLADHGRSIAAEPLGTVPAPHLLQAPDRSGPHRCQAAAPEPVPVRFRPRLSQGPLTQGHDLAAWLARPVTPDDTANDTPNGGTAPAWPRASELMQADPRSALPRLLALTSLLGARLTPWTVQRDLLASAPQATDVVVECEDDGSAQLRFGDGVHGARPDSGASFTASYRIGNGLAGNIGAEAIAHLVTATVGDFLAPHNPLPAAGGQDPEPLDAVRRDAPQAFRTQERAVTAADYAAAAQRRAEVQRAAASFRWTGSWHTVFLTADRRGGAPVDEPFQQRLRQHLARFRMAGYDLAVDAPRFVALDIALHICVAPGHPRAAVALALREVLGTGLQADGRRALFHPDNFSFGEPVYLSQVIATAQAVTGVASVAATRFTRLAAPSPVALAEGLIRLGRLEIARLDHDPNFPERGRLQLDLGGGR